MAETNEATQTSNTVDGDMAAGSIYKPIYNIGKIETGGQSYLEKLYEKYRKEVEQSEQFNNIIEELLHFKKHADDTEVIGLSKKLENGNRSEFLFFAERCKEKFAKKLLKKEHSETAQCIYAFLLVKVFTSFEMNIYPKIAEGCNKEFITSLIDEYIIKPIGDILGENLLRIYDDEIYGMIYFLTGNCHIKWNSDVNL